MDLPLPAAALRPVLRATARWAFAPDDWARVRRRVDRLTRHSPRPRTATVRRTLLAGLPVEIHQPRTAVNDAALLYLHGGGFTTGSPASHRALVARVAQAVGVTSYVPHYRLAPEHPCPAAFDDTVAAYRALLDRGWPAHRILVAGDSAGAALSLMLAVAARDELRLPPPAALGLICPPVEYDPAVVADRTDRDPILSAALMSRFVDTYTANSSDTTSLDLPRRRLAGLPPMVIEAAGHDLLRDDARDLARRAREAGVAVSYTEHPGQAHVFHIMAGLGREANQAVDAFGVRLRAELDVTVASASRRGG